MRTSTQLDHDLFRILLYRRDASELLLETHREGLQLPTISIPRHARVAEQLTKAIKGEWNLDTYCLFPFYDASSPSTSTRFHVVELWNREAGEPIAMRWLPVVSRSAAEFRDQGDFSAIQSSCTQLDRFRCGGLPGTFGQSGWLRRVTRWVGAQADAVGLSLNGNFRQFTASQTFSLLRFETNGPALWFKAVGAPNVHEFSIIFNLARLFPRFVPRVIGWRSDLNAWLSIEAEGAHLTDTAPVNEWQQAARALTDFQITSCGHGLHFIDAGCKDIRVCCLLPLVDRFFERIAELMELQAKPSPPPLARTEIASLAEDIRSYLEELRSYNIPNVLGHLDFNPGNILVSPERCVFLDWAEGCVGHPFFTFQYLLEHWRRLHPTELDSEKALVSSYTFAWRAFASPDEIARSLALLPLLAAFGYATSLSWNNPADRQRSVVDGYLRSLVRRMKREADDLRERRTVCVR